MPSDASQFLAGLAAQRGRILRGAVAGVRRFGLATLAAAEQLAPVAADPKEIKTGEVPGTLRSSGVAGEPQISGGMITMTIGFTDPIAVYVHENLSAHHAQGQAKFLEAAVRQQAGAFPAAMAQAIGA